MRLGSEELSRRTVLRQLLFIAVGLLGLPVVSAASANSMISQLTSGAANSSTTKGNAIIPKRRYATTYTICTDGNLVNAINGTTGAVDYSSADPGAVVQSCITALASTGGTILLREGTYVWGSVPAFPPNIPDWLKIIGEGTPVIRLTTGAPRAFDFYRTADDQLFKNVWLEGFDVDANSMPTSRNHIILGTYRNGGQSPWGDHNSYADITLKDIHTYNLVTTEDTSTCFQSSVWIGEFGAVTGPQSSTVRIRCENLRMEGGAYGIFVGGSQGHYVDDIHIHHCYHTTNLRTPSKVFSSANFHLGGSGTGGRYHVQDCEGWYSADVGVELDSPDSAIVESTRITDCDGGFFITNFQPPTHPDEQVVTFRNCLFQRLTRPESLSSHGFSVKDDNSQPIGTVIYDDCHVYDEYPSTNSYDSGWSVGRSGGYGFKAIKIHNCSVTLKNYNYNIPSTSQTLSLVNLYPLAVGSITSNVEIDGLDLTVSGTRGLAAGIITLFGVRLGGMGGGTVSVNNVNVDWNVTNATTAGLRPIALGRSDISGNNMNAAIRNLRIIRLGDDAHANAIRVYNTSHLTIPEYVIVEGCDFSAISTAGYEIVMETANQNNDKVIVGKNNIWNVSLRAKLTAPFDNTNYRVGMTVSGGAVGPTTASTDYTIINSDCVLDVTGGTDVVVTLKDNTGTTISSLGATPVRFLAPVNAKVDFGAFSVAPTVAVMPEDA